MGKRRRTAGAALDPKTSSLRCSSSKSLALFRITFPFFGAAAAGGEAAAPLDLPPPGETRRHKTMQKDNGHVQRVRGPGRPPRAAAKNEHMRTRLLEERSFALVTHRSEALLDCLLAHVHRRVGSRRGGAAALVGTAAAQPAIAATEW